MPLCAQIGTNLERLDRNSENELPFLNALKTGDVWFVTGGSGNQTQLITDANGYPTSMTMNDSTTVTEIFMNCLGNKIPAPGVSTVYPAGTYVLLWSGSGSTGGGASGHVVSASGDCSFVEGGGSGRDIYYIASPNSGVRISIWSTNAAPNNVRLISFFYSPGSYGATGQGGGGQTGTPNATGVNEQQMLNVGANGAPLNPFNPDFLAHVATFKALRNVDWIQINQNETQNWSDRTPENFVIYTHLKGDGSSWTSSQFVGVPYEVMFKLCNLNNSDCYLCLPYLVTDDYILQLATLALANLNSPHKIYPEFGNEFWNFAYNSTIANQMITWGSTYFPNLGTGSSQDQQYGNMRFVNTSDIFASVWTGGNASRLVRIGAGQNGNSATPPLGVNNARLNNACQNVTITLGTPAVVNWTGKLPELEMQFFFENNGDTLPTGVSFGTDYYVYAYSGGGFTFRHVVGVPVNASGSQSGTHVVTLGFCAGSGCTPTLLAAGTPVVGDHSWTGIASGHYDAFVTAPYFGNPIPASWSGDVDAGDARILNQFVNGGGIVDGTSPASSGGTSSAITAAPGGLSSPSNGANFALQLGSSQANYTADEPKIAVDGGTSVPIRAFDGQQFPNSGDGFTFAGLNAGKYLLVYTNKVMPCAVDILFGVTQFSMTGTWTYSGSPSLLTWTGGTPNNTAVFVTSSGTLPSPLTANSLLWSIGEFVGTFSATGASITGTTFSVPLGNVSAGAPQIGQTLSGTGVAANTVIVSQLPFTTGPTTYNFKVNNSQTVGPIAMSGAGPVAGSMYLSKTTSSDLLTLSGGSGTHHLFTSTLFNVNNPGNGSQGFNSSIVPFATVAMSGFAGSLGTSLNGNSYQVVLVGSGGANNNIYVNVDSSSFAAWTGGGTLTFDGTVPAAWWLGQSFGYPGGDIQQQVDSLTADYNTVVGAHGIRLVNYEGGQGELASGVSVLNRMWGLFERSASMGTAYTNYYSRLKAVNNDLMNHYTDCGQPSANSGYWGAYESTMQPVGSTAKAAALLDALACPTPSTATNPRSRRVVHYHHVAGT